MDYFSPQELACKCGRAKCDAAPIDINFLFKLNQFRLEFGQPMHINSARRCAFWNKREGGEPDSMHLLGRAADIACPEGVYMRAIILLAIKFNFRFGVKAHMVHIDDREPLCAWGY